MLNFAILHKKQGYNVIETEIESLKHLKHFMVIDKIMQYSFSWSNIDNIIYNV